MTERTRLVGNAVYGWLLLLPAAALLAAFTHYPAVATLAQSLFTTGTALRPAKFAGLDNYRDMLEDEVFWRVLENNVWYAVGTIPVSIALAMLMAVWVNRRLPFRSFVRMSYFTPTVLPMIAVANIWLFFYTRTSASSTRSPACSESPPTTGSAIRTRCSAASSS